MKSVVGERKKWRKGNGDGREMGQEPLFQCLLSWPPIGEYRPPNAGVRALRDKVDLETPQYNPLEKLSILIDDPTNPPVSVYESHFILE